ncbi:YrdB family protein, partial [Acinetobacter baumannii]|uniref:YrdB family protein n=1 Tax=Acinetobacter baumannii TaxID=470 RepID=UPI000A5AEAD5
MVLLQYANLAVLGDWGFHTGRGWGMKIGAGVGAPLFLAVVWAMFGSPEASIKLSASLHL